MLLVDKFEKTAAEAPGRLFLHFIAEAADDDVRITYAEADAGASRYAAALRRQGIGLADRVALLLPNEPNWLLWHFADQKIGATTCTLNPDLLPAELAMLIETAGVRLIVTSPDLAPKAAEMLAALGRDIPLLDHVTGGPLGSGEVAPETGPVPRDAAVPDDAILSIVFTSGTTGARSKAVVMPVRNVVRYVGGYLEALGLDGGDRVMLVTPLFHAAALHWGTGLAVLSGGGLVLADRFRKTQFWDQAARAEATVIWTMAAILFILMTEAPGPAETAAMRRIRVIFGNSASGRVKDIRARWGSVFYDGFGMSEAFGTLTAADSFDTGEPYPCAGRPVAGIEMALRDTETGAFVGVRQEGEIVMRYGQGFQEYLGDPQATAEAVRDGWFHTGDIGYVDETGRLFFVDRVKEIIRRGGKNISAKEIENALLEHPDIAEAAAIGRPDPILGETVAVLLVPVAPDRRFTQAEIEAFCEPRLARYKWPVTVLTIDASALPRTPTGKIKKLILKQQMRDGAGVFAA